MGEVFHTTTEEDCPLRMLYAEELVKHYRKNYAGIESDLPPISGVLTAVCCAHERFHGAIPSSSAGSSGATGTYVFDALISWLKRSTA
jgi:hypothetical protein